MIPSLRQFRSWSYPSKFGFVSFFVGLAVTVVLWLFPDTGKQLVSLVSSAPQPIVVVPGRNAIELQLNLAKMEGVTATIPSTEFAVAIPYARPSLTQEETPNGFSGNLVALSNASPLRSENQDLVFAPGKCRFLGQVHWSGKPALRAQASISTISCVLDNDDYYGFGNYEGPDIGFVTPLDQPANKELLLVEEEKVVTLPKDRKYVVRFLTPLRDLQFKGKSVVAW